MGLATFDEKQAYAKVVYFINATGVTQQHLADASGLILRIDSLVVTNADSIAHVITVQLNDGSTGGTLGTVSVAAGAGTAGTPGVDILAAVLPATVVGVVLPPSAFIGAFLAVAVTGGNTLQVTALGGYVG